MKGLSVCLNSCSVQGLGFRGAFLNKCSNRSERLYGHQQVCDHNASGTATAAEPGGFTLELLLIHIETWLLMGRAVQGYKLIHIGSPAGSFWT